MTNLMREKTIDDIVEYLNNGGLITPAKDFDFARDNDAFKYLGYRSGNHFYLIGVELDDEDTFCASVVNVCLGYNGLLCADYAGMPEFESKSSQEVLDYIEKRCQL